MNSPCEICSGDGTATCLVRWTVNGAGYSKQKVVFCESCKDIYNNMHRQGVVLIWIPLSPVISVLHFTPEGKDWSIILPKFVKFFAKIRDIPNKKVKLVSAKIMDENCFDVVVHALMTRKTAALLQERWDCYKAGERDQQYFKPECCGCGRCFVCKKTFVEVSDLQIKEVSSKERRLMDKINFDSSFQHAVFHIMLFEIHEEFV